MWKRDEAVRPAYGQPTAPTSSTGTVGRQQASPNPEQHIVHIGKSIVIKGELNGSEDLTIEGQVEGTIQLRDHVLTIGANGKIKAQVFAKTVVVVGEITGNVTATEKVEIRDNGSVDGDIVSPRVAIAEGAHFRGSVDMQRKATAVPPPVTTKAASQSTAPAPGAPIVSQQSAVAAGQRA